MTEEQGHTDGACRHTDGHTNDSSRTEVRDDTGTGVGVHGHGHAHPGAPLHEHPHHHQAEPSLPAHVHAHPTSFESLTYIVSPLHALDARAKIVATFVVVLGVVTTAALRLPEFVLLVALLCALCAVARLPLGRVLARSASVLPFVAVLALFAPLQESGGAMTIPGFVAAWSDGGWIAAWSLITRVWLAAWCLALLTATTPTADLLAGLRRLHVPDVFVMLLSFIARYMHVFADQLRSLRTALASRAPHLRGRALLRSLGSISGNLLVRSYERGERVYAAMLSRGYTGELPSATVSRVGPAEVLLVICALLTWAALALY